MRGGARRNRSIPKCDPDDTEIFSQKMYSEIPKERHIRIVERDRRENVFCFDIVGLYHWVFTLGNNVNPLSRKEFTETELSKIRRKWRKYEKEQEENMYRPKASKMTFNYTFNDLNTSY
jgi:hypothetical protein